MTYKENAKNENACKNFGKQLSDHDSSGNGIVGRRMRENYSYSDRVDLAHETLCSLE